MAKAKMKSKIKTKTVVKELKRLDDGSWYGVVNVNGRDYSDRFTVSGAEVAVKRLDKDSAMSKFFAVVLAEINKQRKEHEDATYNN